MTANAAVTIMAPFIALLVYVFAFYVGYLVIKAAVRNGVRDALGVTEEVSLKDVLRSAIAEALAKQDAAASGAAPASDADPESSAE